ncbi:hypothetical protein [Pseudomonas chlororaphis]|uniref:hypothetical protein n=1 Tax=Pseudomonas chlororaphis TaxID=587753 RepID=UPI001677A9E4|nr:hypothetical protein [Pseudomonas chlororaphis]
MDAEDIDRFCLGMNNFGEAHGAQTPMRHTNLAITLFAIGVAGFALSIPGTTQAHTGSIYCGSASNGLGVNAVTTQSKQNACPASIEVANAYIQLNYKMEPVLIDKSSDRRIVRLRPQYYRTVNHLNGQHIANA